MDRKLPTDPAMLHNRGEKVSTERRAEKVSTEPPGILRDPSMSSTGTGRKNSGVAPRRYNTDIPVILPHERVFPIQIGSELFRLSGASLSSDAPSYFSQFFSCQLENARENGDDSNSVRTLYIDRDPVTFKDISLHLQGYHIIPRDGAHFVKLFADAQFYSLPRLISQLYEESIFISIGHRDFQIPRELFSDPGNSPNYFSLGFAVFFSSPSEVFPGLSREGLLRPPSIVPPSVPNRSADIFAELLHLLRGYPLQIRSEEHRAQLLRDCRYFHLKGLEQKIIPHEISYNQARRRQEITIRLEDVRQSGISVIGDSSQSPSPPDALTPTSLSYQQQQQNFTPNPPISISTSSTPRQHPPPTGSGLVGYVNYARPFLDSQAYEVVLEVGHEETKLHLGVMRAEFFGNSKTRVSRLFEVIATKLNLPTTQPLGLLMKTGGRSSQPASPGNSGVSEDLVRVVLGSECSVKLDGRTWRNGLDTSTNHIVEEEEEIESPLFPPGPDDWLAEHPHPSSTISSGPPPHKKRKRDPSVVGGHGHAAGSGSEEWIIRTGQWRLRVQNSTNGNVKGGVECVLVGVKIDAYSAEYGRNEQRGFLGG